MTQKTKPLILGSASHCRTEHDYFGVLLDSVSLQDWREVCNGALILAKSGDHQARNWLGQYLCGNASQKSPAPVTVIVSQLQGQNRVLDKLTNELTPSAFDYPDGNAAQKAVIKERLRIELGEKIKPEPENFPID
jgi:hypothetical protein